jgi:pimeloyl-ACP methyl ester carboxylesterase
VTTTSTALGTYAAAQEAVFSRITPRATTRTVPMPAPFGRTHLIEAGRGEPVLLVHGGGVAPMWAPLVARLAPDFHLLVPDRPGAGLDSGFDYRGVDLRKHGVEFIGGLLTALGLERVSIVGSSMGGYFALAFALAHPERVSSLVMLGEPAGTSAVRNRIAGYHQLVGTRGLNALLFRTVLRPKPGAEGARTGLARGRLVARPDQVPTDILDAISAGWQVPGYIRSWYTMVERAVERPGMGIVSTSTVLTNRLVPELGRVTAPTLFLWGEKDPLATPTEGQRVADAIPCSRFQLVEHAGHLVWLDQPDICADAIKAFLTDAGVPR